MSSNKASASAVALLFLKKADDAAACLDDEGDALHDFRVALRRLVTLLDDFDLCGKHRRKLKKIFGATGAWRDAEVQAAWMDAYARRHQEDWALEPLIKELSESRGQLRESSLEGLSQRYDDASARLAKKLAGSAVVTDIGALAHHARPMLRRRAAKASRRLCAVKGEDDAERLHKARLAVKRLRYSLEPFSQRGASGLRELQTWLGELNDLDLILGTLAAASAGGVADPAVLAKAAAAARQERRELFHKVKAAWLGSRAKRLGNIV